VGNETRVKVIKNKVAPPFKQAEFQIMYGKGIYRLGEVIDLGVQVGLVDKAGAWYSYKNERIGQGKKNAADFLAENSAMGAEIERKIREKLLGQAVLVDDEATTDAPAGEGPEDREPADREPDTNVTPISSSSN
jgi:recombination protein RecA